MPEPLAQGDLSRTPFAHVLLHIKEKGYAGSLVVWRDDVDDGRPRQDRVRFEGGRPVAGALTERASTLERGLLPLFARTSGPYAFYEGVDLVGEGERVRSGAVNVFPLVAASLRGSSRDDIAAAVVHRFGDAMLRFHRGVDLEALGLLPEERATVDLLRAKPMPAARLRELSPLEPRMVMRLVYLLAITKSIEPWDGVTATPSRRPVRKSPSGTTEEEDHAGPLERRRRAEPESVPPAPDGLAPPLQERWNEIRERAIAIEYENYFDMLGIPRDSSSETVQRAYFGLVKQWHPDRLPADLAALRPQVERIFRYLTRASETLSDPTKRGSYLVTVQDGGGTPEKERELAAIVDAAMEYRKVEVLLRRRDWTEALALVEEILAVAPLEADYHAARGHILFQASGGDPSRQEEILASLDRALELSKDNDRAHLYKGIALKRWGEPTQALFHFQRAAELNPKNIDAVREVRIAQMRGSVPPPGRRTSKPPAKSESLFGKLFGSSSNKKK
ncbi:MAG: DnaJ domain-containing protein [Sandaracinaceae bacterium]